jgi:chemotaxis methyl-accepting protein methylase
MDRVPQSAKGRQKSDFDIIFLRNNVLIYYKERLKKRAFRNVLETLAPCGILVLGSHETIPFETSNLTGVTPYPYVFRKEAKR